MVQHTDASELHYGSGNPITADRRLEKTIGVAMDANINRNRKVNKKVNKMKLRMNGEPQRATLSLQIEYHLLVKSFSLTSITGSSAFLGK